MRRKILIGSLLVLTLLLLMPSIPAVQQKSIEEGIKQDLLLLNDIETLDDVKHPILYELVKYMLNLRFELLDKLFHYSGYIYYYNWEIYHPILFIWSFVMIIRWVIKSIFWQRTSDNLGWGWVLPP